MRPSHKWLLGASAAGVLLLVMTRPRRGKSSIRAPGVLYRPTMDEWLWLGRAMACESSTGLGQLAVGWALVQRFVAFRQDQDRWQPPTFAALVRAYAVPVNPLTLDPGGEWCDRFPDRCDSSDITWRRGCMARSWSRLPQSARTIAHAFSAGRPPRNPVVGLTDYLSCSIGAGRGRAIGGNCFTPGLPLYGQVSVA
jgi:hypothetical protein